MHKLTHTVLMTTLLLACGDDAQDHDVDASSSTARDSLLDASLSADTPRGPAAAGDAGRRRDGGHRYSYLDDLAGKGDVFAGLDGDGPLINRINSVNGYKITQQADGTAIVVTPSGETCSRVVGTGGAVSVSQVGGPEHTTIRVNDVLVVQDAKCVMP
jgi:hypothetical protein